MAQLPTVTINELFDAGVHFGHKTTRWNPKMKPYLYGERDDIHIIDLRQTAALLPISLQAIYNVAKENGKILFVSTKIQAGDIIAEYAAKCGQYYINNRWLGGTLTNWDTISRSIKTLENLEEILSNEEISSGYTKKELLDFSRRRDKLLKAIGGIRNMGSIPNLIVIIDTNREHLAISEALKLKIPVVAVLDSNSDPDNIEYPIPGNDDAIRSIKLYCKLFSEAVLAGIKDSLTESGVDLGAVENLEEVIANPSNITKIAPSKKFSKAKSIETPVNSELTKEFEENLMSDNQDKRQGTGQDKGQDNRPDKRKE